MKTFEFNFHRTSRRTEERFFRVLMFLSSLLILVALLLLIISILVNGLPALSWEMISQPPQGGFYFGKEGGILNAILGSAYLSLGASFIACIISLPVALYINIHIVNRRRLVNFIRFLLDLLWGVPSIVYGAFAFSIMIYMGWRTSLLAGILTVALFIIPIMVRGMDEVLKTVPRGLLETSFSLGSTKSETAYFIYLRQCISGVITAVLLSFGRAIGDAASILFTTGYTDHMPNSLAQPAATLPLAIFFQLTSPIQEVKERAYASALVLTFIVLVVSVLSRFFSMKYKKNQISD